MRKHQGGQTIVATLIVIVILALLAVVLMKGSGAFGAKGSPRADGKGTTIPGLAKAKAQDEVCKNYLAQLRQSIQIAMIGNDDQFPASLEETRLGSTYYQCPMGAGKEPYKYDPATGEVHCIHPGHEKY